ncbi:hypothetical protein RclHR1_12410003 [Rhizophagus clarus]|nr:hypothetical protein RclHR1_12410003 [Rhizophagus clarus]
MVDLTFNENGFDNYSIEFDDNLSENSDFDNEPEDSYLKMLYKEQSFTSFEILKQCLDWYSTELEFKTKIV